MGHAVVDLAADAFELKARLRLRLLLALAVAHTQGIGEQVEFRPGIPHAELVELLGGAVAGLHSMLDEHFGISIVEYMAAGAIPIAHNSGGPKMDIVVDLPGQGEANPRRTGFLAQTKGERPAVPTEGAATWTAGRGRSSKPISQSEALLTLHCVH